MGKTCRRSAAGNGPGEPTLAQKLRGILLAAPEGIQEPMVLMLVAARGLYITMGPIRDARLLPCLVSFVMAASAPGGCRVDYPAYHPCAALFGRYAARGRSSCVRMVHCSSSSIRRGFTVEAS